MGSEANTPPTATYHGPFSWLTVTSTKDALSTAF
jgi:hypothetical protein